MEVILSSMAVKLKSISFDKDAFHNSGSLESGLQCVLKRCKNITTIYLHSLEESFTNTVWEDISYEFPLLQEIFVKEDSTAKQSKNVQQHVFGYRNKNRKPGRCIPLGWKQADIGIYQRMGPKDYIYQGWKE